MTIEDKLQEQRAEIERIAAAHGVTRLRVFGSVARREAGPGTDLDLLVEIGPTTSSWFPAGLILDLEQLLGCTVDIVTEKGLDPDLPDHVLHDARPL